MSNGDLTIGELFGFLAPGGWHSVPPWPPDAFALAASVLNASEAYFRVLESDWPPRITGQRWPRYVYRVGKHWRSGALQGRVPDQVIQWWKRIVKAKAVPIQRVSEDLDLTQAILSVLAAADQACYGFGIPGRSAENIEYDAFKKLAFSNRNPYGATLGQNISAARARVLPKLHTPQRGLTLRSMSHNIALCSSQILTQWYAVRFPELVHRHSLNLLLLPWPKEVQPRQFLSLRHVSKSRGSWGLFTYQHEKDHSLEDLMRIIEAAQHMVGPVDAIVLPESAVDEANADILKGLFEKTSLKFAIAGIGKRADKATLGSNQVLTIFNTSHRAPRPLVSTAQGKSHRWKIEKTQINQYGLGAQLDTQRDWWEAISLGRRSLSFYSVCPWLTLSVVICEDLARAEPVGSVMHAVGPNLVIALLMDGPQLRSRWSARYATVLAEDPGSSVLTLTSLGMTALSRPPDRPVRTAIALWKDAISGEAREIDLPPNAEAAVLTINRQFVEEWTADNRTDGGSTAYLTLGGVHPVILGRN